MRHERKRDHCRWLRLPRRNEMHSTSKDALVTGTSSGFVQATAALLAKQGFCVFGTSRIPAPSGPASDEMLSFDGSSELYVQACLQTVPQRARRIDLLVNNAGN